MKKNLFKTDLKFKLPIVLIAILVFIGILSYQFTNDNFYIISSIIGVLTLFAIIISIIGLVKSIQKIKKPKNTKRIILYMFIGVLICLLLYLIVANILDAIQYLQ